MLRIFRKQDNSDSYKQIHTRLNNLAVNLLRFTEITRFDSEYDKEREHRLAMSLDDLKEYQSLIDEIDNINEESLRQALDVMRSYSVIAQIEGYEFIKNNMDPILRSTRWTLTSLDKVLRAQD